MIEVRLIGADRTEVKRADVVETELTYPDVMIYRKMCFLYTHRLERFNINGECVKTIFFYRQCRAAQLKKNSINPEAKEGSR